MHSGEIKKTVSGYCDEGSYTTWEEAVVALKPALEESLNEFLENIFK